MTGIYIHIPFCIRKCPYCDFYSAPSDSETRQQYVDALCRNISYYKFGKIEVDSIYFGGGTPSLLTPEQLDRIITACDNNFKLIFPEITIEANPSSSDYSKLKDYRRAGANRISFGIQSAVDSELKFLRRLHNFDEAKYAVENAQGAGFDNISCDIMLGLAGQTMNSLDKTIDRITALPVNHISAYMLKIENGTPFDNDKTRNSIADDDTMCDMYLHTVDRLDEKGFEQYEISNFAKNKSYSRHNIKYWKCDEYIGFGAGAHSYYGGKRFYCEKNIEQYISQDKQSEQILEINPDKLEEYVMLGLRLKWGISLYEVTNLGGKDLSLRMLRKAEMFQKNGLCIIDKGQVSLTPKGFLVSNEIINELLEC